jgi:hypothetical protein
MTVTRAKIKNTKDSKNILSSKIKLPVSLNEESLKREKRIVKLLNLNKLPFKIDADKFCNMYVGMMEDLKDSFSYQTNKPGMKWCLSTIKKFKVFLLIFESNEYGTEIYKENISNKLPEYSYKTVAQIVDEGVLNGYFIKMEPRIKKSKDLKIRNIRPSEEITAEFINWNIDIISAILKFSKKLK